MYFLPARVELMGILSMAAIPFGLMIVLIMDNHGQNLTNAEFVF
jgi:hypothetical protein